MRRAWILLLPLAACGGNSGPAGDAPRAAIVAPADGAVLGAGAVTRLRGQATDKEDGVLSGAALTWTSSLDGRLGAGEAVEARLSRGAHRITLEVVDSSGQRGAAQIGVTVAGENRPPSAAVEAPLEGASFDEGAPVALRGRADDPEEGALPGSSLSWSVGSRLAGTGASVNVTGLVPGTHRALLTAVDRLGAAGYASVTFRVVAVGANHPPTAAITSPKQGASFHVGDRIAFAGSGADAEDGTPMLAWSSSLDGALGAGANVTASLSRGAHLVTLTATDSAGARGSASIGVSVAAAGNTAPTATITRPADGATFFQGAEIAFEGRGADAEDGTVTALQWRSSLEGDLGAGASIKTSSLRAGAHAISLTARDTAGDEGVARVAVTVLPPNQAPQASISGPADGSSFPAGTAIHFRGSATDAEDGAVPASSLTWRSSLDGVLGQGPSLDVASLRAGAHAITLTAVDSGGRSGSAVVGVSVTPGAANVPPAARLTGPAVVEALLDAAFDGSESTDADGTIAKYRFDFGDGTSPVEGMAKAAAHRFPSAGTFTVTLTVTDDKGATGSAQRTVAVSPAVRRPKVIVARGTRLGGSCKLDVGGAQPRVAFLDVTHPSLWLASSQDGAAWTAEEVDGPGFDLGGMVGNEISLATSADGTPHLAWYLAGKGLWAATRKAGWIRERVDAALPAYEKVAIAVDPATSRPTVVYGGASSVVVAPRTSAGWAPAPVAFPGLAGTQRFAGGLAFSPAGVATVTIRDDDRLFAGTWSAAGPPGATALEDGWSSDPWIPAALTGAGRQLVLTPRGLYASGTPWTRSTFEAFAPSQLALATDAIGQAWVAARHGSELELLHAPPGGGFARLALGPMDDARPDVAVDAAGEARACFFREGKLLLY